MKIALYFIVISIFMNFINTEELNKPQQEDFDQCLMGFLDEKCIRGGLSTFQVSTYNCTFIGPSESNGFYLTTADDDGPYCMRLSENLTVDKNTKVTFSIYTSIEDGQTATMFVFAFDSQNPDHLKALKTINITNIKAWRTETIIFDIEGEVTLEIQCESLKNKNAFLAIDFIQIENDEICTTEEPTESEIIKI